MPVPDSASDDEVFERLRHRYGAFKVRAAPLSSEVTPRDVFWRPSFLILVALYLGALTLTAWHAFVA